MEDDGPRRERAGAPQLEVLIRGVFAPARFLDLIRNFVLFEERRREDVEGAGEVPPGRRGQPGGRGDRARRWTSRRARRRRLAHAGLRQELHDGLLRQQAAPRPALREPDDRRGHRPHRPRRPARTRRSRQRATRACGRAGRRDRRPASCTSCSTGRPAASSSRRSRSSRRRQGAARCRCSRSGANVDRDGRRGAPHRSTTRSPQNITDRAAERDPDRLHRHADREGRPLDAARVRRLHLGLPDGAAQSRTAPPSRSTTSRGGSRSRSTTRSCSPRSRRCSRARRTRQPRGWSRAGRSSRRSSARTIASAARRRHRRALPGRRCEDAGGQGDGRGHEPADRGRADRPAAGAARRGRGDLRDQRAQATDEPADLAVPPLEAEREAGRGRLQGSRRTRCESWSCATCG